MKKCILKYSPGRPVEQLKVHCITIEEIQQKVYGWVMVDTICGGLHVAYDRDGYSKGLAMSLAIGSRKFAGTVYIGKLTSSGLEAVALSVLQKYFTDM